MSDAPAREALEGASLVVGGRRHLEAVAGDRRHLEAVAGGRPHLEAADEGRRWLVLGADVEAALDEIAGEKGTVCVLASGDPGFFGVVRPLAARFGADRLEVHPAPSSVAIAFARLGLPWDDAQVLSAHGRPLEAVVDLLERAGKAAVLVSPANPPEALGRALEARGVTDRRVHVCSRLGLPDERVVATDLHGLADGSWDPLSVVVLGRDDDVAGSRTLAWGLPEEAFEHSSGMITKSEVRAVVLGKLELPARGVLWDVGAGSGSVGVEAARLQPGLQVHAVERDTESAARVRRNGVAHGVSLRVVEGAAPLALGGLPDPDRVFIGGGGTDVLDEVLRRLRPLGRVVATYAALERAARASAALGNLVQVGVARGERLPDGGLRLAARNPVFVVWGPTARGGEP